MLFDYKCEKCGFEKEVLTSKDFIEVWCPHCDLPMQKQISRSTSFQLKGSGWYETDFKTKGKR